MLIFPLKKEWYEKIRSGEKRIEYREAKPYWTYRIGNELKRQCAFAEDMELFYKFSRGHRIDIVNIDCVLRLGYTKKYLTANIDTIELINGKNTDLAIDVPVYAIHLSNVRKIEECKKFDYKIGDKVKAVNHYNDSVVEGIVVDIKGFYAVYIRTETEIVKLERRHYKIEVIARWSESNDKKTVQETD